MGAIQGSLAKGLRYVYESRRPANATSGCGIPRFTRFADVTQQSLKSSAQYCRTEDFKSRNYSPPSMMEQIHCRPKLLRHWQGSQIGTSHQRVSKSRNCCSRYRVLIPARVSKFSNGVTFLFNATSDRGLCDSQQSVQSRFLAC